MSEGDQDALIRAIERSRRRRSRLIFGSAGIGICATIALIAYCVL